MIYAAVAVYQPQDPSVAIRVIPFLVEAANHDEAMGKAYAITVKKFGQRGIHTGVGKETWPILLETVVPWESPE